MESVINMVKRIFDIFNFVIKIAFIFSFFALLFVLIKMNVLPFKYFLIFIIVSAIVFIINIMADIFFHNNVFKIISLIFSIVLIIGYLLLFNYLNKTNNFLKSLFSNEQKETYYVAVLKNSDYKDIEDLKNKKIGTFYNNEDSYNEIMNNINSLIKHEEINYNSLLELSNSLVSGEVDAILISEHNKELLEEKEEIEISLKYIYSFKATTKINVESREFNITKDPFILYISGIDTYGDISTVARSDVNIIITVNPTTKKILLVTIPRDYYVQLHGTTGRKDILTHAGFYGIDMSVSTLEDLLGIDIDYYVRLNFSTLIKVIDVIGGIDVYSHFTFNTGIYQFYEGYNTVNGDSALAFSRARKNFDGGDKQRGKNQLQVIEALIKKITTSSVLLNNYLSILESLEGSFQTNIESKDIYALVKMQLSDMAEWSIEKYSLDGFNGNGYTYSLGDILAFVMEPNYNTVNEAKQKIKNIMK